MNCKLKVFALSIVLVAGTIGMMSFHARPVQASPPQNPWQPSGFQGAWCAQGDPAKQCSITGNGAFLTFTNEQGSTSTGHFVGMSQNVVSADQWQFVQGTLSPDATRIDWSNGTFWARCSSGGGGGGRHIPNVDGTVVPRRRSIEVVLHPAAQTKPLVDERGRADRIRADGRALAPDHELVGNPGERHDQPGWRYDLLGQRHFLDPLVGWI